MKIYLIGAWSGLDQKDILSFDGQVAVEASKPRDVRVYVVDQTNLEASAVSWNRQNKTSMKINWVKRNTEIGFTMLCVMIGCTVLSSQSLLHRKSKLIVDRIS